jgi:hypothetical protein
LEKLSAECVKKNVKEVQRKGQMSPRNFKNFMEKEYERK